MFCIFLFIVVISINHAVVYGLIQQQQSQHQLGTSLSIATAASTTSLNLLRLPNDDQRTGNCKYDINQQESSILQQQQHKSSSPSSSSGQRVGVISNFNRHQYDVTRRESLFGLLKGSYSGAIAAVVSAAITTTYISPYGISVANAASDSTNTNNNVITPDEIRRIQIGYEQINYLLNHFDEETTICRENGGECKRDANAIRKVLGLRSTTDPLFQIDKVFTKFKNLDSTILNSKTNELEEIDIEALYDAAEDWNSSISMSNSMAFISQFGEYNPGGGKDEVLKYLLESKKQVLLAKDALQRIMINLKIPY